MLRASSLNATAQHLSGFLLLALPFVLFRITRDRGGRRWFWLLSEGVLLTGILLTWNYMAFFAVGVVLIVFPFLRWPRLAVQILIGAALLATLFYYTGVLEWLYEMSFGNASIAKGLSQRLTLLNLGFEKLYRNPWVGVGLQGFPFFSGNFWHRPVHDAYIQAATELGVLGAIVFITMLATLATQLAFLARAGTRYSREVLLPALLAFLGLVLLMLGEPMLDHSNTWLFLGLVSAMISTATFAQHEKISARTSKRHGLTCVAE